MLRDDSHHENLYHRQYYEKQIRILNILLMTIHPLNKSQTKVIDFHSCTFFLNFFIIYL